MEHAVSLRKIQPPPFVPYDYQVPIIRAMVDTALAGENGLVIQPTATGKSTQAAFVARALILLHGKRGLYLYNEDEGISQARNQMEYVFRQNSIQCANFFGLGGKEDAVIDADMVFASFQALNNHWSKEYQLFDRDWFDFIIVNEGHHSQAVTYKEVLDYFTGSKIGMTATPIRMDGKDILEVFDKVIYEMLFEEALVKGYIAKLEYHIKSHGLSTAKLRQICHDVLQEGRRISIKQLNETLFIDQLDRAILDEVYKYAFPEGGRPRQTVVFCENIEHCGRMSDQIQADGYLAVEYHSYKTQKQNHKHLTMFRKREIQFICVVDKMNEDIDLPELELGVLLRATGSLTVFFQQMGRLLRKTRMKESAILLDFVANCERIITIADLMNRLRDEVEKQLLDGPPLSKDILRVSGEYFDFAFDSVVVDVLQLVQASRLGFYETLAEASSAVQVLGIKGKEGYGLRYKEDPRLPSQPCAIYPEWISWPHFLGKEMRIPYETLAEAEQAVQVLGIKGKEEYVLRYKEDPRLPSNPNLAYHAEWISWSHFLGKEE